MVNYFRKALVGATLIFVMNALANLLAFTTKIILARNLSITEYGLFYAVFNLVMFLLFFRDLGLGTALVKYIAEFKVSNKLHLITTITFVTLFFQLISSIIFSFFLYFFAGFLATSYFKEAMAESLIKLFIMYIILSVFFKMTKYILRGFQNFRVFSLFEFLKNGIILITLVIFFMFGHKTVLATAWAYVVGSLILFCILLPFAIRTFPFFQYPLISFKKTTKKMFLFGLPVLFTGIGGKVIGYLDTLILTYFGTLEQVGVYNAILPSAMLFLFVGTSLSAVVFPMTSELFAKKDFKRLTAGINLLHKYTFLFMSTMILALFSFAKLFITLSFGLKFNVGTVSFQILLVGVLFYIIAGINNNMISGIGKPKVVTITIVIAALINVTLNVILIPIYGIIGAAIATSVSYFIVFIISTIFLNRILGMKSRIMEWIKLSLLAIMFLFFINFLKDVLTFGLWANVILSITMAGTLYLLLAWLFKVWSLKELKYYFKLFRK